MRHSENEPVTILDPERWMLLMARLSLTCDLNDYHTLAAMLDEPGRAYHNSSHVADCLAQQDACNRESKNSDEVELAIWFHDAVYDPRRPDNEEMSADFASSIMQRGGASESALTAVRRLILATKHDALPNQDDERLITDIDLSILGRDEPVYDRYEAAIRDEYSWVPWNVYRVKRNEVLNLFLARDRIYSTQWFVDRYESQARQNLRQAINTLKRSRQ